MLETRTKYLLAAGGLLLLAFSAFGGQLQPRVAGSQSAVAGLPTAAAGVATPPESLVVRFFAKVYLLPSEDSPLIGITEDGARLPVYRQRREWVQIGFKSTMGWIRKEPAYAKHPEGAAGGIRSFLAWRPDGSLPALLWGLGGIIARRRRAGMVAGPEPPQARTSAGGAEAQGGNPRSGKDGLPESSFPWASASAISDSRSSWPATSPASNA